MYAMLCNKISKELPPWSGLLDANAVKQQFRRALLNRCQEEFEKKADWSKTPEEMLKETDKEVTPQNIAIAELERQKIKRRSLGNISFIGELFKLGMLTAKIMWNCVRQLLAEVENPDEEEVESLCKLLSTIGKHLDVDRDDGHAKMDVSFAALEKLSVNKKLSSRVRFMLKDVIELRGDGWKPRRAVAGPKTIEDIHDEVFFFSGSIRNDS